MKRVIALSVLLLAGCIHPASSINVPTQQEAEYQNATALAKEKKYAEAIAAFRKISLLTPSTPKSGDALFEAARLQVFYDNPQKDYAQALSLFEEFLKRYPGHVYAPDAENWRVTLKTLLELRKENERLNRSIEQLKKLDIRHEERRSK